MGNHRTELGFQVIISRPTTNGTCRQRAWDCKIRGLLSAWVVVLTWVRNEGYCEVGDREEIRD